MYLYVTLYITKMLSPMRARLLTQDHSRVLSIGEVYKVMTDTGWTFYFEPNGDRAKVLQEIRGRETFKIETGEDMFTVNLKEAATPEGNIKFAAAWISAALV